MMITAYALTCKTTQKAYVGYTTGKLNKRAREHRCLLRNGKHTSGALQSDWDKFGEQDFDYRVLESVEINGSVEHRKSVEQKWLDDYAARGLLYNTYTKSHSIPSEVTAMGVAVAHNKPGDRWTPEANLRRRLSQLGIPKGHGAKISATKRAKKLAMR